MIQKLFTYPHPQRLSQNEKSYTLTAMNLDILIALFPSAFWAYHIHGSRALTLMLFAVLPAILADAILSFLWKRPVFSFIDLSSTVASLTSAMLLPASAPVYCAILAGSIAAISIKAWPYLRSLPFSPAALSLSVLTLIFGEKMYTFPAPEKITDAESLGEYSITPLAEGNMPDEQWYEFLFGDVAGPMGALSVVLILAGGIYLLIRGVASVKATLGFLAGAAAVAYLISESASTYESLMYVMLTGQFAFASVFLVSAPDVKPSDQRFDLILPLGAGALSVYLAFEGILLAVPYAVLVMNAVACVIRHLPPAQKAFGTMGKPVPTPSESLTSEKSGEAENADESANAEESEKAEEPLKVDDPSESEASASENE